VTPKTCALYRALFVAMHDLVPEFVREQVMADFEEASVAAFYRASVRRDIDIAIPSVRLSVRLSVTFRYQMKTA